MEIDLSSRMFLKIKVINSLYLVVSLLVSASSFGAPEQIYQKALYSKVITFDPAQLTDTASLSVANQIYESLLELDEHNEIGPALAESWQTVDDGKKLIFHLRKNVKFHNGKEMDSSDCVSSFERLLGPESKVATYYTIIAGADDFRQGKTKHVSGLRAPSKYEFEILLKNPFPPFVTVLTGATARILPKEASTNKTFFDHPVGTGPFQVNAISSQDIKLKSFPLYWREKAKMPEINFQVLSQESGIKAAANGTLYDLSTFPLNGDESIFKKGQDISVPVAATWLIGLNVKQPPFDDLEVRRTFINAISSEDFVKRFYPGQTSAVGYIPPLLPGHIDSYKQVLANKVPKSPITLYIPAELAKAEQIRQYFEVEFRKKGFKLSAKLIAWDDFMKNYSKKSMQAFLFYMNADFPDTEFLARNFESTNEDNFSSVSSSKLDTLIRSGRNTPSRIERAKIYKDFAQALQDEALTINLMHYRSHYWVASCVRGLNPSFLGDPYISYRSVYLDGKCDL